MCIVQPAHRAAPLLLQALLVTALLVTAPEAAAQEEPPPPPPPPPAEVQPSQAEKLLAQAHEALAAGRAAEACGLLSQSDALAPHEDVKFELAQCQEKTGKREQAASTYEAVAGQGGARAAEAARRGKALRAALLAAEAPVDPAAPAPVNMGEPVAVPVLPEGKADESKSEHYSFSDFMDTRLTWTFGDDDLLHETGVTTPLSPDFSIGDRKKYRLFFDNLNSQFGGRENLTHLVLYKKMPGFIDRLDTEASLVLRFNISELSKNTNNINSSLYDAGSFIRLFYRFGNKKSKTGMGLTFWPLDTDRFRLGYLYDISWGGTNARINQSIFPRIQGSSPGARLKFSHDVVNVFFGFKTAQIVQVEEILTPGTSEVEVIRVGQTNYGLLGGGGVKLGKMFNADLGGGYFQQGKFDLPDVLGERVFTFGLSARLAVHSANTDVKQSADFSLYRNDPMKHRQAFAKGKYKAGETSWSVAVEGSNLWQNLKDFDESGATRLQQARAAALQGNLQHGFFRMSLTGIYRDLAFVLRNVPSFVPFETLPAVEEAEVGDELFVALAGDYHFKGPRLTPGIGAGLQFPATFTTNSVDQAGGTIGRTVVVRQQGDNAILPIDADAVPIFQARVSLKWDISTILSAIAWLQYTLDNNGTFVERDPNEGTVALREFVSPSFMGFGTSVQARF